MPANPIPNPTHLSTAPGRVNLLGEHVDYNDGMVLPAAIDRAAHIRARQHSQPTVTLHALDLHESVTFALDGLEARQDTAGLPLPDWALYPAGIAWVLPQHGYPVMGFEASFTSDVPIGSGLSSSAAMEVGFAALWRAMGGWQVNNMELAQLCLEAERRYVGVNCGLMDQFASAHGVEGHALYFDTRSLAWHPVPLPPRAAIIVADSGVRRSLANSAYNERRAACEEAVRLLKPQLPGITALRDVTSIDFVRFSQVLPPVIARRARHVVEECERVTRALALLEAGDAAGFGQLMLEGHASLRDLYEVSIPELDVLVEIASGLQGCWGARLSGAGFGGCTVNLVEESRAHQFIAQLTAGYERVTGRMAQVYLCRASRGAHAEAI